MKTKQVVQEFIDVVDFGSPSFIHPSAIFSDAKMHEIQQAAFRVCDS